MPELPEVETVVRVLRRKVVGATITGVWFDWPKMIKDAHSPRHNYLDKKAVKDFKKNILGKNIVVEHMFYNRHEQSRTFALGLAMHDFCILTRTKIAAR